MSEAASIPGIGRSAMGNSYSKLTLYRLGKTYRGAGSVDVEFLRRRYPMDPGAWMPNPLNVRLKEQVA